MPKFNPKDAKRQMQSMRQGTRACPTGEQGNRSGKGPKGKRERRQGRCGTPGRKNTGSVNRKARSWENDDKTFDPGILQEAEMPERFGSRVQFRSQRRQQRNKNRAN
jgi:hypothetical protein